jgi:hypothetical protein
VSAHAAQLRRSKSSSAVQRRTFLAALAGAATFWPIARVSAATVSAEAFGVHGDGHTDATTGLNTAASHVQPGGTLHIPPGRYRLTNPLLLRSGTTLTGPGATLFAMDEWASPPAGRDGTKLGRALVGNTGHTAGTTTDRDITVRDINFQYIGVQSGEAHAIRFRMARNIVVDTCTFSGGGNGTAFLACHDTEVVRCISQGTLNCAYDHWEGTSDSIVHDCVATCARGYGILFTGVGTEAGSHRQATRLTAVGNRIFSPTAAGIWICSLSQNSSVSQVVIRDNLVRGGPIKGAGIGATGRVNDTEISGNRVEDIKSGCAIFVRPDQWNRPRAIRVLKNQIARCQTDDNQVALIQALGDDIEVRGNRALGGKFPAMVWGDGQGLVLSDNTGGTITGRVKYRTERTIAPQIADP